MPFSAATGADPALTVRPMSPAPRTWAACSFVINRNILHNICYNGCSCGFSRHRNDEDAFDRSLEEIAEKVG
jgi:2-iminoacetate synthase ThiH